MKEQFENFLNEFNCDVWMTVTFRRPVTVKTAKKMFKYFLQHINKPDDIYYEKYIYLWAFFENDYTRGGVHVHAIIDRIDTTKTERLQERCSEFFGESKVMTAHQNVVPYLSRKYNTSSLIDFDYMKINSRLR